MVSDDPFLMDQVTFNKPVLEQVSHKVAGMQPQFM